MKVLELFSGTGSIGKVAEKEGYEVVSLDMYLPATIKSDIMKWDYKSAYPVGHFDVITASPVCAYWSHLKYSCIGRKMKGTDKKYTRDSIKKDIDKFGKPMVDRVREIINYFKPKYYWIENPQSGSMKNYITNLPYYDIDYCMYSNWGYRKRTRFWTNIKGFNALKCDKKCGNMKGNRHMKTLGFSTITEDGKLVQSKKQRELLRKKNIKFKSLNSLDTTRKQRYRIPPILIQKLFKSIVMNILEDHLQTIII
jgi:hypothetical protein